MMKGNLAMLLRTQCSKKRSNEEKEKKKKGGETGEKCGPTVRLADEDREKRSVSR